MISEKVVIRKAKLKDVPVIVELWKEFMKEHDNIVFKKNPEIKPHLTRKGNAPKIFGKFLKKNIISKNGMVYVADVKGKPAGYCQIYIANNNPILRLRKIGHLGDLFVKKGFRDMKISSKLRDKAIEWFRKRGIKYVSITVYKDNEYAHSIYKGWGFSDQYVIMKRKA